VTISLNGYVYWNCHAGNPSKQSTCIGHINRNISDINDNNTISEDIDYVAGDNINDNFFNCFSGIQEGIDEGFITIDDQLKEELHEHKQHNNLLLSQQLQVQRRVQATPILNNNLNDQKSEKSLQGTFMETVPCPQINFRFDNNINSYINSKELQLIRHGTCDNNSTSVVIEGQIQPPSVTTTIETYLEGNTKYIDNVKFSVKEVNESYDQYRCGMGASYNYDKGGLTKALKQLGHIISKERFIKGGPPIPVVIFKRKVLSVTPIRNPVEAINAINDKIKQQQQVTQVIEVTDQVTEVTDQVTEVTPMELPVMDKNTDIRDFFDNYMELDSLGTVDVENMYLCLEEYCRNNGKRLHRFGMKSLVRYLRNNLNATIEGYNLIGYRCKKNKLEEDNRIKEEGIWRIWQYNTAQYKLGWKNGKDKERYNKMESQYYRERYGNLNIIGDLQQTVPNINKLIEYTREYNNKLAEYIGDNVIELMTKEQLVEVTKSARYNADWCMIIRSTFGTQKTVNIRPYVQERIIEQESQQGQEKFKALIVVPTKSLTEEYIAAYRALGFTIYTDVTEKEAIFGDKIVVCYPSLWRVAGQFDLMVLDEYKAMKKLQHTLVKKNNREKSNYEALTQRIKYTPRVYVADALMTNDNMEEIGTMRESEILVYQNFNQKHRGKIVHTVDDVVLLINRIITTLREGKRAGVAVNSKILANFIGEEVAKQLPEISQKIITSESRATGTLNEELLYTNIIISS
jgi:hypothetical protein